MRKLLLLVSAFALACGSDSDGGGGGQLAGTVGGRAFTPVEVRAVLAGSGATPCTVPNPVGGGDIAVGLRAVALEVTSYEGACGEFAASQCPAHANAQSVTVLVAKLNPLGAEPALRTGTYAVQSSPTTVMPDGFGMLDVAYAQALETSEGCAQPSVQGGTIRLDQVAGTVTGNVSLTFRDGSSLSGDFSAPVCPAVSLDVCSLATTPTLCALAPVCAP